MVALSEAQEPAFVRKDFTTSVKDTFNPNTQEGETGGSP